MLAAVRSRIFQVQLQGDVGIFRRVAAASFQRDLVKCELILPLPAISSEGNRFVLPASGRQRLSISRRPATLSRM